MKCPICFAGLEDDDKNKVRSCPKGHGALLLAKTLRSIRNNEANLKTKPDTHLHDRNRKIDCPKCREQMSLVNFNGSGIMVDACTSCHSRWLDAGELNKINEKYSRRKKEIDLNIDRLSNHDITLLAEIKRRTEECQRSTDKLNKNYKKRGTSNVDVRHQVGFDLGNLGRNPLVTFLIIMFFGLTILVIMLG